MEWNEIALIKQYTGRLIDYFIIGLIYIYIYICIVLVFFLFDSCFFLLLVLEDSEGGIGRIEGKGKGQNDIGPGRYNTIQRF